MNKLIDNLKALTEAWSNDAVEARVLAGKLDAKEYDQGWNDGMARSFNMAVTDIRFRIAQFEAEKRDSTEQSLNALELAYEFIEGYEDGAPDASKQSKQANHALAEIRKALNEISNQV